MALEGSLQNLVDSEGLQWVFVGGKGGVGKTTTSSSLAVSFARKRESVLLVSTDPAHNISDAFGQKFTKEPTAVRGMENLFAMEVDVSADGSLRMLESGVGSLLPGGDSVFPALDELIKMVPGIDEAIAFGVLIETIRTMNYKVIIFDTAPTGHTLRLLGFPNLFEKAIPKLTELNDRFGGMLSTLGPAMGLGQGPDGEPIHTMLNRMLRNLQNTVNEVTDQFQNATKTTFVCVCIPEFLSVYETERLVQELSRFKISVRNIVINQIIDLDAGVSPEVLFEARSKIQMKYLQQIDELYGEDFHVAKVPILPGEVRGTDMIIKYRERLLGQDIKSFGLTSVSEYEPSLKNLVEQHSLKWVFCGGKGGVGKTTTSCALASALAADRLERRAGPVLIISTDPAHNLSDAFRQKIAPGGEPTKVAGFENLFAIEVDPQVAAESILPREVLKDVAKFIPGIDELVSFSQIARLVNSMEFSSVVFDTAPTGHTLKLLNFPKLFQQVLEQLGASRERIEGLLQSVAPAMGQSTDDVLGNATRSLEGLQQVVKQVGEQMQNPDETTFVCVAIAEYLSVYETERLVQELCTLEIDTRNIVVNQLLDPEEADKVALLRTRAEMQKSYISQIYDLYPTAQFHITKMPIRGTEVRGIELLKSFASSLVGSS